MNYYIPSPSPFHPPPPISPCVRWTVLLNLDFISYSTFAPPTPSDTSIAVYKSPFGHRDQYWHLGLGWALVPILLAALPYAARLVCRMAPTAPHLAIQCGARDMAVVLGVALYTPVCINLVRAYGE